MKIVFEQKKRFDVRKYTLYSDKILVEIKTVRENERYELKLDKIGHNIHYQSDSMAVKKTAFYICFAVIPAIIWILHFMPPVQMDQGSAILGTAIFWAFALVILFRKHDDDIFLVDGQRSLVFFRTIPNEESVLNFINQVIETSRIYLKNKYGIIDINVPEDLFLSRINWLREEEIISEKEFYELKNGYIVQKFQS